MWEDENLEHEQSHQQSRKHHKHHHRNRHKSHHGSHKEVEDRIDVYVAKRGLKGPPTKPKPNMVELRKSHSIHSKTNFDILI